MKRNLRSLCKGLLVTMLAGFILSARVSGQGRLIQSEVIIYRTIELSFEPSQAYFFVEFTNGESSRLRAVILPLQAKGDNPAPQRWAFGALLRIPGGQDRLKHSLLISGDSSTFIYVPPEAVSVEALQGNTIGSVEDLKQQLVQKAAVSSSWRVQLKAQEDSLKRLQQDAELIGDIGRIVDVQEEMGRIQSEYNNLEKDLENLKNFLILAKNHPTPQNFVRRELELTRQIAELAAAARKAEESEPLRRTETSLDLRKRMEMVEATRFDDAVQLQQRLVELRRQRMELEKRYGSSDRLPPAEVAPENFDVNAPL